MQVFNPFSLTLPALLVCSTYIHPTLQYNMVVSKCFLLTYLSITRCMRYWGIFYNYISWRENFTWHPPSYSIRYNLIVNDLFLYMLFTSLCLFYLLFTSFRILFRIYIYIYIHIYNIYICIYMYIYNIYTYMYIHI